MKDFIKTKWFIFGTYLLLLMATLLIGYVLFHNNQTLNNVLTSFFEVAENRSFDYRQSLKVTHKQPTPNKDIVVLAIDDASLEMLWDKYGEWPVPRNIYANVINHIEKDKPQAIIFDLMFIKSMRASVDSDQALISAMNKYNNIYTAMNFDNQPTDVRLPIDLPERLSINLDNKSQVNLRNYNFTNCRAILNDLLNGNVHVGMTNVIRNNDGIIRKVAPIMTYRGKYYPYLSFGAGANYITGQEVKDFSIDKNSNLKVGYTSIPLNKDGEVILNWYGPSGTHTIYPMYKLINEIEGKSIDNNFNFRDKIVIIGTTAMSLHDTKSVPVQEGVYPGVEVHATFFNNMLDSNFIKKTNSFTDTAILIIVVTLVGAIVMASSSSIFSMLSTALFAIGYLLVSYYIMNLQNLWIPVVMPTIAIIVAFALSYIAKYLIKSKDFEYQYKLATTDGLTDLYNHRYFQETLKSQVELSKRYEQPFSLIIVDIDHFKNFNDTYGHQAGDAVLRQVADTLKKNSRTTDSVCRYGGEEMSIILPNTNAEEALFNAKRINKSVADTEYKLNNSETAKVTISVGVATFPNNGETAEDMIKYADQCLYIAKSNGRNQVINTIE